jgi:hypothetical protein
LAEFGAAVIFLCRPVPESVMKAVRMPPPPKQMLVQKTSGPRETRRDRRLGKTR